MSETIQELLEENRKLSYWLSLALSALQFNLELVLKSLPARPLWVATDSDNEADPMSEIERRALIKTICQYVQPCREFMEEKPQTSLIRANYELALAKMMKAEQ